MNGWQARNNQYLAASLQWLRLRLASLLPPPPLVQSAPPAVAAQRSGFGLIGLRRSAPTALVSATSPTSRSVDAEVTAAASARAEAAQIDPPPALQMLAERLGLSDFERDIVLLCAAVEIDPGIVSVLQQLQGHASRAAPTFALALQAFDEASWDALSPHRPLRYARLIDFSDDAPTTLTTAPLRADERIVHYIKGLNVIDLRLGALLTPAGDDSEPPLAPSQQNVAAAVLAQLQAAGAAAQVPLVQLVGTDAGSRLDVACEVCRRLGRHLYRLGIDALPPAKADLEALVRLWQRERLLLPIALYLDADELQGAGAEVGSAFSTFTSRDIGLAFIGLRELPAKALAGALCFEVNKPSTREQSDAWARSLAATAMAADAAQAAPTLAGNFDLNLRDIGQGIALAGARAQQQPLDLPQLWSACRQLAMPQLDQLAQRLEPKATWDQLVLSDEALGLLRQIAAQVRNRFRVYEDWGYGARLSRGLGISALFAGESGTGKTMAAEVIANELELALYRIDLAGVVSKYIGETEKNLRRLFDAAEQGGAILFFDEADALFGKRSEVKDSHDRYANIEINYLLQRMEAFSGLAILATNMKSALDNAFMRRLRFIVNFPYPGPAERRRMWQHALPAQVPSESLDFERLSRLGLSGGNIHSIALNAAFMAAARGTPVTQAMLMGAARAELRKLDKPVSEADFR